MMLHYVNEMTKKQINHLESLGFKMVTHHCLCGSCDPEEVMVLEELPAGLSDREFLGRFVYTSKGEIRES